MVNSFYSSFGTGGSLPLRGYWRCQYAATPSGLRRIPLGFYIHNYRIHALSSFLVILWTFVDTETVAFAICNLKSRNIMILPLLIKNKK